MPTWLPFLGHQIGGHNVMKRVYTLPIFPPTYSEISNSCFTLILYQTFSSKTFQPLVLGIYVVSLLSSEHSETFERGHQQVADDCFIRGVPQNRFVLQIYRKKCLKQREPFVCLI